MRTGNFASLVAGAFDEIRGSAGGNLAILLEMLGSLQALAGLTEIPGRRRVFREHAESIAELAGRTIASPRGDRVRFEGRLARLRGVLRSQGAGGPDAGIRVPSGSGPRGRYHFTDRCDRDILRGGGFQDFFRAAHVVGGFRQDGNEDIPLGDAVFIALRLHLGDAEADQAAGDSADGGSRSHAAEGGEQGGLRR